MINTELLIIGCGPVAQIAYSIFKKKNLEPIIIGKKNYGALSTVLHENRPLNCIPVFPKSGSKLVDKLNLYEFAEEFTPIKASFADQDESFLPSEILKDSYYEFASANLKRFSGVLSYKLFGQEIFNSELPLARLKIERHYGNSTGPEVRIGFNNGCSIFTHYMNAINAESFTSDEIISIDIEAHIIETRSEKIRYDLALSTVPLPRLFSLTGINDSVKFFAKGTKFMLFELKYEQPEDNILVYDCSVKSPIYRIFIPQKKAAIVQLANNASERDEEEVSRRLHELLPATSSIRMLKTITMKECYPLSPGPDTIAEEFQILNRHGLFPFGRFGQWDYVDFHELDWETMNGII